MKGYYLNLLNQLSFEKKKENYPTMPEYAVPKSNFKIDSANSLTKAVILWVKFHGGAAFRVNSTGIFDDKSGKWRPSGGTKGMPDVVAIHNSKFYGLEIKWGKDSISLRQVKIGTEIIKAGGVFKIVSDWEEFAEWWMEEVVNNKKAA